MTASVVGANILYSAQPDRLQEVANAVLNATSVPGGGVVAGSRNTFIMSATEATKIVSQAAGLGLKAYVMGALFTVEQNKNVADAGAGAAVTSVQPAIARYGQWKITTKIPGEPQAFFQDSGEFNSAGMLIQYGCERINPAICARMVESCPQYRNGMSKHIDATLFADPAGSRQSFGDYQLSDGEDFMQGFGTQMWQTQLVSVAGGQAVTPGAGANKVDMIPFPFCRSAGDTGRMGIDGVGEGLPLEVLTKSNAAWEFTITRVDATGLYPVGTTFGDATVRMFLFIRLYRDKDLQGGGNDPRALGPMWYGYSDSTNLQPYNIPLGIKFWHISVPPSYRDTTTYIYNGAALTLQVGYAPVDFFASLGVNAQLRWIEKRNNVDKQVFPILDSDQHPEHVVYDMHNEGSKEWQGSSTRYLRSPLQPPDVKRAEQPWQAAASTRIHRLVAGCVTPTNLKLAASKLQETGCITSRLWELPVALVYPSLEGFPGGPINCGDIQSCPSRIESQNLGVFATARTILVLRDAGKLDNTWPGGFKNSSVSLSEDGCECVAEHGATLDVDNSKSPRAQAAAATGYLAAKIPGTGNNA